MEHASNRYFVYSDGSCIMNPGPAGYSYVIFKEDTESQLESIEVYSKYIGVATNNQAELTGAIMGIRRAISDGADAVLLISDSQYICKMINDRWIERWIKKNWKTTSRKPVKNRDLVETIYELSKRVHLEAQWVKGHDGNLFNEIVDDACREAAQSVCETYIEIVHEVNLNET